MRVVLIFFILASSLFVQAQSSKRVSEDSSYFIHHTQNRKWSLSPHSGVGVGFNFINGSAATLVTAWAGLQLNRQLTNNLFAFANVSAGPAYTNFNRLFLSPGISKAYPGSDLRSDRLGFTSSASLGLMYVNDARTFSISGSIGVNKSSYPILYYPPLNVQRLSTFDPTYR